MQSKKRPSRWRQCVPSKVNSYLSFDAGYNTRTSEPPAPPVWEARMVQGVDLITLNSNIRIRHYFCSNLFHLFSIRTTEHINVSICSKEMTLDKVWKVRVGYFSSQLRIYFVMSYVLLFKILPFWVQSVWRIHRAQVTGYSPQKSYFFRVVIVVIILIKFRRFMKPEYLLPYPPSTDTGTYPEISCNKNVVFYLILLNITLIFNKINST